METINLLNGKEFCPSFSIKERLEEGRKSRSLIYTDNLRGIGKTHSLIEFAKEHGYMVAVRNSREARIFREKYDYKNIYGQEEYTLHCCKNIVIDESVKFGENVDEESVLTGFTNTRPIEELITLKSLNDSDYANAKEIRVNSRNLRELMAFSGISIKVSERADEILGMYIGIPVYLDESVTESFKLVYGDKKSEVEYPEQVIESLKKDALKLSQRLTSTGLDSEYKMLITNLRSTVESIQYLESHKQRPYN
jgi:hypothetical protein